MEMLISVGIPTSGKPQLEQRGSLTVLKNMLIGKNFHWQKSIEAILPGEVHLTDNPEYGIINRLPLETYLQCVIGSEMNPEAPEEFLKAHSVISRSWALGKILNVHSHSDCGKINLPDKIINWEDTADHMGFDICSDDHCQRYQGLQPIPATLLKALEDTRGEVLVAPNGRLVDTRFSKCCGGHTEVFSSCWQDRREECLESFSDPWCNLEKDLTEQERRMFLSKILKNYDTCDEIGLTGGFRWQVYVSEDMICRNLHQKFNRKVNEIKDIRINSLGPSGRATELSVLSERGELLIGKELMIRRLLSPTHLYSSNFVITPDQSSTERGWILTCKGWGHGVGLCQIGAARMADTGHDYRQILSFYYPGSHLTNHPPR